MDEKSKPYLFMTHASYAGGVRASARQFDSRFMEVEEISRRGFNFGRYPSGGSLLANSFNQAWCNAINARKDGWNVQWFVMLHDDIVPEDWWVRTLMEDLETSGADMVSAMVPIKDTFANTSTAISVLNPDPWDGGHWTWQTRITMAEAEKLPEVFTAADCSFPDRHLLVNSGCWICRFDRPWVQEKDERGNYKLFFTINDRIRDDPNTGLAVAEVEPEDWFFSRRVQELGGKVACTRRVKLLHYGLTPYPNFLKGQPSWGSDYDLAHAPKNGYKARSDKIFYCFKICQETL